MPSSSSLVFSSASVSHARVPSDRAIASTSTSVACAAAIAAASRPPRASWRRGSSRARARAGALRRRADNGPSGARLQFGTQGYVGAVATSDSAGMAGRATERDRAATRSFRSAARRPGGPRQRRRDEEHAPANEEQPATDLLPTPPERPAPSVFPVRAASPPGTAKAAAQATNSRSCATALTSGDGGN